MAGHRLIQMITTLPQLHLSKGLVDSVINVNNNLYLSRWRGIACSYHIQGVSTNYAVRYEEDTGGNEKHIGYICGNGKAQLRMVKEKRNIIFPLISERITNCGRNI